MRFINAVKLFFLAGALMTVFTGCGKAGAPSSAQSGNANAAVRTYTVATRGTAIPFTYVDDKGNLTGFDIEILKEVEKRNPDIHFNFKTMDLSSAFVAMQSKQIDLIANQMSRNAERDQKYIFTGIPNNYTATYITVRDDRNDIQTLDDLRGKKVAMVETSEAARFLHQFSDSGSPAVQFVSINGGAAESFNLLATGRVDATLSYVYNVESSKKSQGIPIKTVGDVILETPTYYLLRKDADMQKLADRITETVKAMKEDGTLKKLSVQYLGDDYTNSRSKSK